MPAASTLHGGSSAALGSITEACRRLCWKGGSIAAEGRLTVPHRSCQLSRCELGNASSLAMASSLASIGAYLVAKSATRHQSGSRGSPDSRSRDVRSRSKWQPGRDRSVSSFARWRPRLLGSGSAAWPEGLNKKSLGLPGELVIPARVPVSRCLGNTAHDKPWMPALSRCASLRSRLRAFFSPPCLAHSRPQ